MRFLLVVSMLLYLEHQLRSELEGIFEDSFFCEAHILAVVILEPLEGFSLLIGKFAFKLLVMLNEVKHPPDFAYGEYICTRLK